MKFLSFSIALLLFSSFDFSGVKGSYSPKIEDDETYFPIKMKLNKFADWAVYHFHGDIYFKDEGDVELRVSVGDKHKDCGITDRPNRPIMKSKYADHDKGYMYGYMKKTNEVGNLHLHDLVGGRVTFENEVEGVAVKKHCDKIEDGGGCEVYCSVSVGDFIARENNKDYFKSVSISNRKKYTPCGVDLFFRQQTKGSEIADSDTFSGDYFVGDDNFEKVKPHELSDKDEFLQNRLWCLDRDCGNRAEYLIEDGEKKPFNCMDLIKSRRGFGVSECNGKEYESCVVDLDY